MSTTAPRATGDRRHNLQRRIRGIVTATIAYNIIEAAVAITAGTVALTGFGLDSTIEVLSRPLSRGSSPAVTQRGGRGARTRHRDRVLHPLRLRHRLVRVALTGRVDVERSTLGIVITAISVVIMPFLSLAERRAGRELGSATAVADSKQTLMCTYLSAAVLAGLIMNNLFGWWRADAIAGLMSAAFAIREGTEACRGDACATSFGMLLDDVPQDDHEGGREGCRHH